jgi:SAM-dependent methyltransferase
MPSTKTVDLGEIAFYWRMADTPDASTDVPTFLPFAFGFEPRTQLITQEPGDGVAEALRRTYLHDHNIGYMQQGHALADRYGGEFLGFIRRSLADAERRATSIMDVGCGGCYVLNALKEDGYRVFGVDPSPVAARWGQMLGIPIAAGFYPVPHRFGPMDVVLSSGVLEHVPDPVGFLRAQREDLAPDGHIIMSTPDCAPSIEIGDASMILHEHLSYFDEDSLRRAVAEAGYDVVAVERARYGASLYCLAQPASVPTLAGPVPDDERAWAKFEGFAARLHDSVRAFTTHVHGLLSDPAVELGFYVPLRVLPYLSLLKTFRGVRFFDDDPGVHGKYFDGFPIPVEDFRDLEARPVTHMVIMSLPHAATIARKLHQRFPERLVVRSLQEIITAHAAATD